MRYVWILLIAMLTMCVVAEDLRVTLDTPSITYRDLNVGDTVSGELKATNKNNFSINVSFGQPEEGIMFFNTTTLTRELISLEQYVLFYTINITKAGDYAYTVPVTFETKQENVSPASFMLSSSIKFINITDTTSIGTTPIQTGSSGGGGGSVREPYQQPDTTEVVEAPIPVLYETSDDTIIIEGDAPAAEIVSVVALPTEINDTNTGDGTTTSNSSFIFFLCVVLIAGLAYYAYKKYNTTPPKNEEPPKEEPLQTEEPVAENPQDGFQGLPEDENHNL